MKGTVHCMVAELEDTLVTVTLAGCAGTWAAGVMSNNYVVITQLIFDLIAYIAYSMQNVHSILLYCKQMWLLLNQ